MEEDNKYSLPKTIINELKNPLKAKNYWSIIKMFPAILFLVGLYLIADRYISSQEKTETTRLKNEFLLDALDGLSSKDSSVRRMATFLTTYVINEQNDPTSFLSVMYEIDSDSSNQELYLSFIINDLNNKIFNDDSEVKKQASELLKKVWIKKTDIIPDLINKSLEHPKDKEAIHLVYEILVSYDIEILKVNKVIIEEYIIATRNIKSDTRKNKTQLIKQLDIKL